VQARDHVTPLVLTLDEEDNLGRTLEALAWARRVVVLDSGSTDATERLARAFPNVAWFSRTFDDFRNQTLYGVMATGVDTEYVLALDADMEVPAALVSELESRFLGRGHAGARIAFDYAFDGRRLLGSVYPSQVRLFRPDALRLELRGHGHHFAVEGSVLELEARLVHDDRKSLERWLSAQLGYSRHELARLEGERSSRLRDLLRRAGVMPLAAFAASYVRAGGPLAGRAALRYAYERATYEALLALRLLRARGR
jgi:glycosyltransferase involved in cell wall biosynthesis